MTDKEMIDEISESLMYCTHKDREVYPWDSSQRQMAKRVIELARLGEKYEQLLADMKERKVGTWIHQYKEIPNMATFKCSCCGCADEFAAKYCSNCGARMEEVK